MRNGKAALGFIFVVMVLDITGIGIIIPVMPDLIMELTGKTVSEASEVGGWLLFAYAAFQFFFSPILGALSDRFGRRPVILLSLFGFGLDFLILALAPTLVWLFIARILSGIMGASITAASAYIADVSTPEKRAQNFGLVGAAFGIGFIVGPVVGGLLGELGTRVPFFVAAGLSLLNCLYGYFVLPESLTPDKRRAFSWKRANPAGTLANLRTYPVIAGLVFAMVFVYIASHAVQSTWTFFTIYRYDWSKAEIGISLGLVGLLSGLVQGLLIRWLIPKIGNNAAVYSGMVLYLIGLVLFASASEAWMIYPYLVVYCLGGIAGPALQGIMSNQVPDSNQGELQGGLTSLMSATSVIGPPLMTGLFAFFTGDDAPIELPGAPMLLGALLVLIGLFFSWRTLRKVPSTQPARNTQAE